LRDSVTRTSRDTDARMTRGTRYSSVLFLTVALGLGLTRCSSSEPWAVENTGRAAAVQLSANRST
jgi:hypothetical protein